MSLLVNPYALVILLLYIFHIIANSILIITLYPTINLLVLFFSSSPIISTYLITVYLILSNVFLKAYLFRTSQT